MLWEKTSARIMTSRHRIWGTNSQTMDWLMDTFANLQDPSMRQDVKGVVTGKSLACGGSEGREESHRRRSSLQSPALVR